MSRDPIPGTHEPGWQEPTMTERKVPEDVRLLAGRDDVRGLRLFRFGDCNIMLAREPVGPNLTYLWHLSISCLDRHPTWDEIKTARYRLLPGDLCFGMLLPPAGLYVNLSAQDHVFHLWEITDPRVPWED
jgi:hypothetical protein